jgi:hypothetical protein
MAIPFVPPAEPLLGQGAVPGTPARPNPSLRITEIEVDDDTGQVRVRDSSAPPQPAAGGFEDNLAAVLDEGALAIIAEELLRGIEADERSRREMLEQYTRGMDLLGLKLEGDAAGFAAGQGGKNISRIRHPILLWACVRFQAGARNELLPAAGPVKVRVDGEDSGGRDELAKDFERDFNHYLTVTATEYYPDTDRGLFYLAYGGTLFKKVYHCPLRGRPVSECVYMPDLIVSNDASDLSNAQRITHRFEMAPATVERLQQEGFYLDVTLVPPTEAMVDPAKRKEAEIAGIAAQRERPEDRQRTIYECYADLDLGQWLPGDGEQATQDGNPFAAIRRPPSVLRPYRVSIDRDSRKILEIRRNWKEGDPAFKRRRRFVKYGLVPGFGFYDYGFLHLIGNHAKALTALWRLVIDAGMFSTFPGGLRLKGSRASTNEFRPGPGEFPEIDAAGVEDIRKLIMAMPYKEPSPVILQMIEMLMKDAAQIAGTVELELGEGRTNMPVGTILSMIEQQTQVMSAVHKRNHASQQEELLLLKELFAEDPSALARFNPDPARAWAMAAEFADLSLVPASDPNVPAQIHRIMQSTVLWMMGTAAPQLFNQQQVVRRILRTINIGDIDSLLNPNPVAPAGPAIDPRMAAAQAELPLKQQKLALSQQELLQQQAENRREAIAQAMELQQRQQDRALKAAIEGAKLAHARAKLAVQAGAGNAAGGGADVTPSRAEGGDVPDTPSAQPAEPASIDSENPSIAPAANGTATESAAPLRLPSGEAILNPLTGTPLLKPPNVSMQDNIAIGQNILDDYGTAMMSLDTNDEAAHLRGWGDAEIARALRMEGLFERGGPMDYQRSNAGFNDTFTPFSSYNYGAVARAAGYSLDQTLFAAGRYNRSSTGDKSGIYGNNPKNVPLITQGWQEQPDFVTNDASR